MPYQVGAPAPARRSGGALQIWQTSYAPDGYWLRYAAGVWRLPVCESPARAGSPVRHANFPPCVAKEPSLWHMQDRQQGTEQHYADPQLLRRDTLSGRVRI